MDFDAAYRRIRVYRLFGGGRTSLSVDVNSTCRSSSARCAGCEQPLSAGDLVMRVHLSVFHSTCFSCCVCRRRLSRGQHFALDAAGRIYCRADCQRLLDRSTVTDPAATSAGRHSRRSMVGGDCDGMSCDEDVRPTTNTDDAALSPSDHRGLRTLCRGSRRTRKLAASLYQNNGIRLHLNNVVFRPT